MKTEASAHEEQQCFYCKEWYPTPVAYHHDETECIANQEAAKESL